MKRIEYCEDCQDEGVKTVAAIVITGMGPGCSEWSCCGYEAFYCDDHATAGLSYMPEGWGLTSRPYDQGVVS